MIVFCVTLLLLHQGYALVSVTTVKLGEPVTFTCVLPLDELSSEPLCWFKQSVGDDLKLIVTFVKHSKPVFGPEFSDSRLDLKVEKNISNLTILRTTEEDEGMYHCAVIDWYDAFWSGTYLSLKGKYVICFLQCFGVTLTTFSFIVLMYFNLTDLLFASHRKHSEDIKLHCCSAADNSAVFRRKKKELKTEECVYSQVRC
uniref:Ig-like domain-containing protein n=1 Tax=Sparus aurata TaxID=8175 RepID=A0A671XXE7_SPAAU